jgi:hypothetical protein
VLKLDEFKELQKARASDNQELIDGIMEHATDGQQAVLVSKGFHQVIERCPQYKRQKMAALGLECLGEPQSAGKGRDKTPKSARGRSKSPGKGSKSKKKVDALADDL